jgi:uncharacterized RDD family membrane protein YckC
LSASPDEGAGFATRLGAFALDALLVFVVAGPLVAMVTGRVGAPVLFVILPALATIFCWYRYGATPGKIAFSLRVVDARSGGRPSLLRLAVRCLAYIISAAPLFLGFAWIAIDRRKQAWHDKIAATKVVYDDD